MSTLWVFGDSFAENHRHGRKTILAKQWHRIVARELGFDYQNFGLGGSSLDYTYCEWHREHGNIEPGDLVIAAPTGLERRWLVRDQPRCATPFNFFLGQFNNVLDSKTIKAMGHYYRYLDHNSLEEPNLYNWLCAVDRVAARGVKVLILSVFQNVYMLFDTWQQQFPNVAFAKGHLVDINCKEHSHELIGKGLNIPQDGRCNHITAPNHEILADKILEWYRNDKTVNLYKGFYQDIIKDKVSDDPELFACKHVIESK